MIEQYLERLFTWESLENTERGVEFELKNRLIEAEFQGVTAVKIDGESVTRERITLELSEDERYTADEITPENPLELGLAETVQVVLARDRLRLGVHELEVRLEVEGYGEVGFTTDDEIRTEDLVDVDPAERTVEELEELAAGLREPETFERLLERERDGKNRTTAVSMLEEHLEAAEPLTEDEMVRAEPTDRQASSNIVNDLLIEILESPQRVSVYLTVQTLGGGTPEEIAGRTVLPESTVRSTLEDFESEGVAERSGDTYTVVSPVSVLQKRQNQLWNVLRSATPL
jgi:DNA-binding MarR family transcriptional regulator